MTFFVLFLLSAFVGYNTIIGIENVSSYHVETDFLPLVDSILNSEHIFCNATYLATNITRQIASKPNITVVLCNIQDNQRTTNNIPLQTCVDVFTDIEIEFSCSNFTSATLGPCVNILETFTTSFPYDNGTLDVIYNCSDPKLTRVRPQNQSNHAKWTHCKDISQEIWSNCSVACIGSICSINTRCVNDIDPRCLIPKYRVMLIRIIYDCVHHSRTTKAIHVPSSTEMATTRIPDLTTTFMLTDSSTISREEIQKAEQASKGLIIGGTVGSIAFVAIFVVLAVLFKRVHTMKPKTNGQSEGMVGSLIRQNSLKDYTGIQMIAYPGEGNEHLTIEMQRDVSDNFQNKYGIRSDQRETFKKTDRENDSGKSASEYTLAKSIPNKLQLPNIKLETAQTDCGYSMANPISKEYKDGGIRTHSKSDLIASNIYQDSPEGVYDKSKSRRNTSDVEVYDRATDGTYDTTSHCAKRRTENDEITYDHFTGPKTNDNYDLVIRPNQVIDDDTYGVN